ncbi:DUF58 domain-containing protein [Haloarchaeobius amylolyticus]|uniref:DUF58 domain-containing protein n=1 Tax=Haloarchaeobius amylolyticus TaxID=1198296 RepID=UPI002271F922|nr:DUF58 domain-containing protein [Haloarchaeobius amylolyticus]
MILTRRGIGAIALVVLTSAMAIRFGSRQLGAIIIPVVVALLGAGIQLYMTGRPEVTRKVPDDGYIGETKPVRLVFDLSSPVGARVVDDVPTGVRAAGNEFDTTIGDNELTYEIEYLFRGQHELGPLSVTVRDVLGLTERTYTYSMHDTVLVYPRVYTLTGATRHDLNLLPEGSPEHNREEFDSLREYARGDSLRDVHWKSSAKRTGDDLVVKEFIAEDDLGDVKIAAEAADGWDDEMAEAAASIALYLLDAGIAVGLAAPNGDLPVDAGADQREAILHRLATVGPGQVPESYREEADIVIVASENTGVSVEMRESTVPFESFVGDATTAAAAREVSA